MKKPLKIYIALYVIGLLISVINPKDYFTWFLEVVPTLIGFGILAVTYKRFAFTNFTYFFILLHCFILLIGGHYTYAEVPLFDWINEVFHQSRNNYDKVGHFAQGFVPAMITRELFIRKNVIANKTFFNLLIFSVCLAISAIYELIEWWVALYTGENGNAFLGTQGYLWDTQSDMAWALSGAFIGWFALKGLHDKQLRQLRATAEKGQS